jgi:hypothetical protein
MAVLAERIHVLIFFEADGDHVLHVHMTRLFFVIYVFSGNFYMVFSACCLMLAAGGGVSDLFL